MASMSKTPPALLSLPYDIRYLIYQHLFPRSNQLYLSAENEHYYYSTPENAIPTALLRTCRSLRAEGCEYLYNHYLFNILGLKRDCIAAYDRFVQVVRKYARDKVHVHALGNGAHSATMCVSLHAGARMTEVVRRRGRGEARRFEDVRAEIACDDGGGGGGGGDVGRRLARWLRADDNRLWYLVLIGTTVLVGILAWVLAIWRISQW